MPKGTTPNKRLPTLPGITINSGNWLRLRSFLSDLRYQFEKIVENPDAPDQVRNLALTIRATGIYLTWRQTNRATSYVVYRAVNSILFSDAVAIGWVPRAEKNVSFFDAADQNPDAVRWTYWVQAQTGIVLGPISVAVTTTDLVISGGSGASRGDVELTTASLADQATESGSFALGKASILLMIVVSEYARVRFYSTSAGRDADVARDPTTEPDLSTGLLLDVVLNTGAVTTFKLQPAALCHNLDGTVVDTIYYNITNLSGSSAAITATCTRLLLES